MGRRNQVAKSTQRYLKRTTTAEWRTALYARLSNENNGLEDDRSLQNQIKYLQEYADKKPDLAVVDTYVDNGRSGLNFERVEFKRMMEDVKNGTINCIVVKDLSRFGRNHIEAGYYLEKIFPQMDVRFISINDNFDSMDESRKDGLMIPMKNMINEMYARDTQRKVLSTLRAKEKKGERPYHHAPYGYVIDPDCNYHLLPDDETAGYVRLIFSLRAGGLGTTAIADRLNRMGVPTPLDYMKAQGKHKQRAGGNSWDYKGVQQILVNRTYTGSTVYNTRGKGEYKVLPDTHEALVDEETFETIGAEMAERGKRKAEALKKGTSRAEKHPNILQGVFYCGNCGHAMLYDRTGNTKIMRSFRYRCGDYSSYRKDDPDAPPCAVKITSVPEQVVYKFLLDQIRRQLRAGLEVEELERLLDTQEKEKKRQVAILKDQEAGLKQKLRKLYEDFVDRIITDEEYMEIRKTYTERIKHIEEEIAAIDSGEGIKDPWAELKQKVFGDESGGREPGGREPGGREPGGETVGIIQLTETSSVEIVADDEPDMVERLLRRGLTRELVEAMIERLEYSVDGSFTIKFKCEDYVEKLVMRRLEMDMAGLAATDGMTATDGMAVTDGTAGTESEKGE